MLMEAHKIKSKEAFLMTNDLHKKNHAVPTSL